MNNSIEVFLPKVNRPIIIDIDDLPTIMKRSWRLDPDGYIRTGLRFRLHNVLMGRMPGREVDHKDQNKFNFSRSNLRWCSRAQNMMNRGKRKGKSASKYKGIYYNKRNHNWVARIYVNGFTLSLGAFENEHDAAEAYNKAAIKYYKEFAALNIITR